MKIKLVQVFLLMFCAAVVQAQSKVVVVPLGGGPYADMYWVTVNSDGSTQTKTQGVISTRNTGSAGSFEIFYDRDNLEECFAIGNVANTQSGGILRGSTAITKQFSESNGLFVKVVDRDGVDTSLPFTVQLACPPNVIAP